MGSPLAVRRGSPASLKARWLACEGRDRWRAYQAAALEVDAAPEIVTPPVQNAQMISARVVRGTDACMIRSGCSFRRRARVQSPRGCTRRTNLTIVTGGPISRPSSALSGPLPENKRKARYGVFYLGAVSAQAGYSLDETSPDSDELAVDCTLAFEALPTRVQVKCTTREFTKKRRYISWAVEDHWREKWSRNLAPIYFVIVRLKSKSIDMWFDYHDEATLSHAAAYWTKIEPKAIPANIIVPETNRLTAETIVQWDKSVTGRFADGTDD